MPYMDWQTKVLPGATKQEYGFLMSTTVDELSYMPSEQEKFRDAAQVVATGRKSWKTLKGKGEAVWPPLVEAALLEALEKYQPESVGSKSEKTLGRFPRRNRFISDHIFETTGKKRTPKQVGSRLQQLRDTCKKERILQLISRRSTPEAPSTTSQSEGSVQNSPSPCPETVLSGLPRIQQQLIHVTISLQSQLWPAPIPCVYVVNNRNQDAQVIQLSPSIVPSSSRRHSEHDIKSSNILSSLSRTIELPSPWPLASECTFSVYLGDYSRPLHTASVPLKCVSSPKDRSGWLYTSDLVPQFWETLCSTQDVTRYTIVQHLKPLVGMNDANSTGSTIGILYKFAASERMLRKASLDVGSMYQLNDVRPGAQLSTPVSQPASALNYSPGLFSPISNSPDNNWVQSLSHTYREYKFDPCMNNSTLYGSGNQNYRVISTQIMDSSMPRCTAPEAVFETSFHDNIVDSNSNIYAPVPVQPSQHFQHIPLHSNISF